MFFCEDVVWWPSTALLESAMLSLNIPSGKGPTRSIESNSWLPTGPPKNQTLCLRAVSKRFSVSRTGSVPCPLPWEPVPVPGHPLGENLSLNPCARVN